MQYKITQTSFWNHIICHLETKTRYCLTGDTSGKGAIPLRHPRLRYIKSVFFFSEYLRLANANKL